VHQQRRPTPIIKTIVPRHFSPRDPESTPRNKIEHANQFLTHRHETSERTDAKTTPSPIITTTINPADSTIGTPHPRTPFFPNAVNPDPQFSMQKPRQNSRNHKLK
jgi:hypothetical protein